jgi:putative hydrolase of the HAD superfamily
MKMLKTKPPYETKAVLFDLDDTLFDHRHSCRCGLAAIQQKFEDLREIPLDELEQDYMGLLNELHPMVLQGVLSLEKARVERFHRLLSQVSENVSPTTVQITAECYQQAYRAARRPVPGGIPLLKRLKPIAKVAVISNNLIEEQREKLKCCGLVSFVDCLVVSKLPAVWCGGGGYGRRLLEGGHFRRPWGRYESCLAEPLR